MPVLLMPDRLLKSGKLQNVALVMRPQALRMSVGEPSEKALIDETLEPARRDSDPSQHPDSSSLSISSTHYFSSSLPGYISRHRVDY